MIKILLITLLCALVIVAAMMLGLGIKMLLTKHGEFKRHCSSMDPYTGQSAGCICAKSPKVHCKEKERYSPLEVNENLMEETRS